MSLIKKFFGRVFGRPTLPPNPLPVASYATGPGAGVPAIPIHPAAVPLTKTGTPIRSAKVMGFLYEGDKFVFPNSKCVRHAVYNYHTNTLYVTYKRTGVQWEYDNISEQDAANFYFNGSMEKYIWDNIRVRGKGNKHKHQTGITARKVHG